MMISLRHGGAIAILIISGLIALASVATTQGGVTGSVAGRAFIDMDSSGGYSEGDVPLPYVSVSAGGPSVQTGDDGTYLLQDAPVGPVVVEQSPQPCADWLQNDWVGVYILGFCPVNSLPDVAVEVMAGQTAVADLASPAFDALVSGRIWLDGMAAPDGTVVSLQVGGNECWSGEADLVQLNSGVPLSTFGFIVPAGGEPGCTGGAVTILADGRALAAMTWNEFWQREWTDWVYKGDHFSRLNLMDPPFTGVAGRSLGMTGTVRALVNGQVCGQASPDENGYFYGMIVAGDEITPGCGDMLSAVTYCVGDKLTVAQTYSLGEYFVRNVTLGDSGSSCPPLERADADCDGDHDATDGLAVLRLVAGLSGIGDCWNPGDVDCDGDRDSVDGLIVLRQVAGLPTGVPVDCRSFELS